MQKTKDISDKTNVKVLGINADVTNTDNLKKVKHQCLTTFPKIDILLNNARVISITKAMALEWRKYNINVNAISLTVYGYNGWLWM